LEDNLATRAVRPVGKNPPILAGSQLRVPVVRPQTIVREDLLRQLRHHDGPSLVVAPPGFGKSTLLATWASTDERPFAWLSLDQGDTDPVALWSGVLGAIREVAPGFGDNVMAALRTAGTDLIAGPIPLILNAMETCPPFVFVMDDCHWLTDPESQRTLGFLIEHMPTTLSLALSSRADPAFPLARLRAAGNLLELRQSDLSFTLEETGQFLTKMLGLDLSPDAVAMIHDRTEGWPAGLYLAYLSLRESTDPEALIEEFTGTSHHVADYLSEVVLDSLDEPTRELLLSPRSLNV
jgi:LuxR family maltose regulon positive regulatory protein